MSRRREKVARRARPHLQSHVNHVLVQRVLFTTARVELVFAARLFVEQVDAGEEQLVGALVPAQNVLCAVAVVHVEINDGDALHCVGVLCEGVQSANHDAVENAKAT